MARPRDPEIEVKVIEACVELLAEVGRAGLTRANVAAKAGVSLPAVTRRYANVDDMVLAVARTPPRRPASDHPPAIATSLREHLLLTLTRTARALATGNLRRSAVELLAAAASDDRVDEAFRGALRRTRDESRGWLERARDSGEIRVDTDIETFLDTVAGSVYYRLLWRGETLPEGEVASLVDQLLLGITSR